VVGKAAIRARYADLFARLKMSIRYEMDKERMAGIFGTIRGRMVGTRIGSAGFAEEQGGKFVMLFRKDRGRWLIASFIWNADR
jgi:ketosteroid isomerase-like protein